MKRAAIIRPLAVASVLAVLGGTSARCQSVAGIIEDSLLGQGRLPNATLWIQDTATHVQTDRAGRFRIDGAPAGTYSLSFSHPSFDSAGISPPSWRVTIPPGGLENVRLATPSPQAAFGAGCTDSRKGDVAYVVGRVRDAVADTGVADVQVTASWLAPAKARNQKPTVLVRTQTQTGDGGRFVLCPVPKRGVIAVQAAADSLSTGIITYSLKGAPVAVLTLRLATRPTAASAGADTPILSARLHGAVRTADGEPLPDARVSVDESMLGTTDASGAFALADLPLGTHVIEVSAIGHEPSTRVIDLRPGDNGPMELEAGGPVQRLPSLAVTGTGASSISMNAIEDRVRRAGGYLVTAKDIEKRRPRKFEDILRGVPGLSILPALNGDANYLVQGDRVVSSRGRRSFKVQPCSPTYFLDGAMVQGDVGQSPFPLPVDEIRAIEIYTAANEPLEYHREGGLCGVIAVWTKRQIGEGTR
jgi:Carboxypeptidase regulatory-like domain/TonB-dependent Receptor Plug Domain